VAGSATPPYRINALGLSRHRVLDYERDVALV
jgi:hypothetical protein